MIEKIKAEGVIAIMKLMNMVLRESGIVQSSFDFAEDFKMEALACTNTNWIDH